jgi:hypothetical protein
LLLVRHAPVRRNKAGDDKESECHFYFPIK